MDPLGVQHSAKLYNNAPSIFAKKLQGLPLHRGVGWLVRVPAINVTHLSWASRWLFNGSGGYASCEYATAGHYLIKSRI